MSEKPSIIYGMIDPARFDNPQKRTLTRRRPSLYKELAFYRAPTDTAASKQACQVKAAALQYRIDATDFDGNLSRCAAIVKSLQAQASSRDTGSPANLVVLPAYSFCGPVSADTLAKVAEKKLGKSTQAASDLAVRLKAYLVASFIEQDAENFYHTAVILAPDGKLVGSYRQTHLDEVDAAYLSAGNEIPVIETPIGKIGIMLNDDFCFPEVSGMLALKRADLIAAPVAWSGQYGGRLQDAAGLFDHPYAGNTMVFWYAAAKTAQAYTIVANSVGNGNLGSSGVFTINPIDSLEVPVVASVDKEEVVCLSFTTLGDNYWMNQTKLIGGRRADLASPLVFPLESDTLKKWRDNPGFDINAWAAYRQ